MSRFSGKVAPEHTHTDVFRRPIEPGMFVFHGHKVWKVHKITPKQVRLHEVLASSRFRTNVLALGIECCIVDNELVAGWMLQGGSHAKWDWDV